MERVESWGDVSDEVVNKFIAAVDKLREETVPRDCDNDSVVDLEYVDRRHYERMHYFAVPYRGRDRAGHISREEALLTNAKMAIEALDTELRMKLASIRRHMD